MELYIRFTTLPQGLDLPAVRRDLDTLLEDDAWITGSHQDEQGGYIELELEDERTNPKYGILSVKNYLRQAKFAPDTAIELAGVPVGIYE